MKKWGEKNLCREDRHEKKITDVLTEKNTPTNPKKVICCFLILREINPLEQFY